MMEHQSLGLLYQIGRALHESEMIGGSLRGFFVLLATIIFIISILQCLFGYKLYRFWVALCGFITFGIIGGVISGCISNSVEMGIFFGIIFAIIGTFIVCKLDRLGIFILCASMGFLFAHTIVQHSILSLVIGIIVGVLGIFFIKPVIIFATSIAGGIVAGSSLSYMLRICHTASLNILGILFVLLGLFIQFYDEIKLRVISEDKGRNDLEEKLVNLVEAGKDTIMLHIKRLGSKVENKLVEVNKADYIVTKEVESDQVRRDLIQLLCRHKVAKYIMPLAEYILYLLGALEVVLFFIRLGTPRSLTVNFTVFFIFTMLCFIKGKYKPIVVTSFIMMLSKVMLFSLRMRLTRFIDIIIMVIILAISIKKFMDSTEDKMLD